jgi:phosphatidylglycerophosphate synthase
VAADAPTRRSYSSALSELRSAQKPSKGAPAYSRYINRPLGRRIAAAASVIGLTPNMVTLISGTTTMSGIAVIALVSPSLAQSILVSVLLVAGYALDAADGQLARLQGGGSLAGEWLDHVVDAIKTSTLHGAILISWFRFTDLGPRWMLVPLGFMSVAAVFFFGVILTDLIRRMHRGSSDMILSRPGKTSALYSLAVIPADYGTLCLSFLLFSWRSGFVALYTALLVVNALILAASLVRWFRELEKLG